MIFPLAGNQFEHQFGVRALPADESILLRTDSFDDEVNAKRRLIAEDRDNYCAVLSPSHLKENSPAGHSLDEAARFISMQAGIELAEEEANPMDQFIEAALSIQEDLVICRGDASIGFPMIAGVVCFPSGWTVAEKIGLPIHAIHEPVPDFAKVMGRSTGALMDRLRVDRPVWRTNWGVRPSGTLDQSPKHADSLAEAASSVEESTAGQQCYFRVERQTLSRLPQTGDILFTIHTMHQSVAELEKKQQAILLKWLQTCPVETLRYKGIATFCTPLCEWLRSQAD